MDDFVHYLTRPNVYPNGAFAGAVRYNINTLEVFDGVYWQPLSLPLTEVNFSANNVLSWARKKMLEEEKEAELIKNFPAYAKAKENLEMIKRLISDGDG